LYSSTCASYKYSTGVLVRYMYCRHPPRPLSSTHSHISHSTCTRYQVLVPGTLYYALMLQYGRQRILGPRTIYLYCSTACCTWRMSIHFHLVVVMVESFVLYNVLYVILREQLPATIVLYIVPATTCTTLSTEVR
jgi:hypothetical protein